MWALACTVGLACGGSTSPPPPGPPSPPPPPPSSGYSISYSTYIGGNREDEAREPVLLSGGRLLFGARVESTDMPTTGGGFQRTHGGGAGDSYLAIMNAEGTALEAATYFGGSGFERPPYGIEIAAGGDVVFGSATSSANLPTSGSAYRRNVTLPGSRQADGYVCRISPDLSSMRWCTYLDGGWPRGGLLLDASDNVVVAGDVTSDAQFSTTPGAFQSTPLGASDAFVLKLRSDGSDAIFATLLGGSGGTVGDVATAARAFPNGDIAVTGISASDDFPSTAGAAVTAALGLRDVFILRMNSSGTSLVYSTLFGGSGGDFGEHPLVLLPDESVLTAGVTGSSDLVGAPGSLSGALDGFVARLRADGSSFDLVSYVGGSGDEQVLGPVVDSQGRWYVYGSTTSPNLPVTADALQPVYAGGTDGMLFIFDAAGSLVYCTYIGGSGEDLIRGVAVSQSGEIYMVGRTRSTNFPTTPGALQGSLDTDFDGFVVKLSPDG